MPLGGLWAEAVEAFGARNNVVIQPQIQNAMEGISPSHDRRSVEPFLQFHCDRPCVAACRRINCCRDCMMCATDVDGIGKQRSLEQLHILILEKARAGKVQETVSGHAFQLCQVPDMRH